MDWLEYIGQQIGSFVNGFLDVVSYIRSILQSLRYGLTTLLSGLFSFISDLFNSGLF